MKDTQCGEKKSRREWKNNNEWLLLKLKTHIISHFK